ncbi:MAG: GSU2403 family nucleotidyltransferase fold protein [Longimicrobiales bacterium]
MNENVSQLERALHIVLWQIRDYLNELVLIGGWVPHLYRKYGGFTDWKLDVPFTSEVDILISPPLKLESGQSISKALRAAGFSPLNDGNTPAVWVKDPDSGEQVEFLVAHTGSARQIGKVVPVSGQPDLGALSLDGLELLARHTTFLTVLVGKFDGEMKTVQVRVPRLGAYVINKAITFPKRALRPGETINPKRAKDLLYLRNLVASGNEVVARIELNIREMAASDANSAGHIRNARNNLGLVLNGALQKILPEAAQELTVRFGMTTDAAVADLRGHLTDLFEILEEVLTKDVGHRE